MSLPTAFDIGRMVSSNVGKGVRNYREQKGLEEILSNISQGGEMPQTIEAIISQFSPERQQIAANALMNRRKQQALMSQGLDPNLLALDPNLQKEIIKSRGEGISKNNAAQKSIELIQRAREIAKTGHLGPKLGILGTGRNYGSTFSKEGQKLRSEYQQIGKALVQAAAPLKLLIEQNFSIMQKG